MSLARALDDLQARRNEAWRTQALRMERAQAAQNLACCRATPGARALELKGGLACFLGAGHPLSQALAMGLGEPLEDGDLDRIEALLSSEGGVPQFEVCPLAEPGLFAALGRRGYRVQEFQLAWSLGLGNEPLDLDGPPGIEIRPTSDGPAFLRVVMAGFMECEPGEVPGQVLEAMLPTTRAPGSQLWGAFRGDELLGGGTLYLHEGTALLAGAGVPPGHRRQGIQGALIRARLEHARAQGCDLAVSGTAPGSPSQRNMERHGFRVAFPKVVLLADGPRPA